MKGDFLKCGVLGWGMEIFWTGLHALGSENWKLTGYSSLWMFPIYGMAACIGPVSKKIQDLPLVLRGSIYMTGIFTVEYLSGMFLSIIMCVRGITAVVLFSIKALFGWTMRRYGFWLE